MSGENCPHPATERDVYGVIRCADCKTVLDTSNYDPIPWCGGCGAMRRADCPCGPLARNN